MTIVSDSPLLSVIVPACGRPNQLAQCLGSLAPGAQTYPKEFYEVIVSDDSKDSQVRELVESRFPWAIWTAGPRRNAGANRNHGVTLARHDWFVFTDDDCVPTPRWLASFANAMVLDPAIPVWEGRIIADRLPEFVDEIAPVNTVGGNLWSANMAVRREAFADIHGFDEDFERTEDIDFRDRLLTAGRRFVFVPQAEVCHPLRVLEGIRPILRDRDAFYLLMRKHPEKSMRHEGRLILRFAARELLKEWPSYMLRGKFRGSRVHLAKVAVHTGIGLRLLLTGRPAPAPR